MRYRDLFFPLKDSHNVISDIQALPVCHLFPVTWKVNHSPYTMVRNQGRWWL